MVVLASTYCLSERNRFVGHSPHYLYLISSVKNKARYLNFYYFLALQFITNKTGILFNDKRYCVEGKTATNSVINWRKRSLPKPVLMWLNDKTRE
jgi:hypothetical protein